MANLSIVAREMQLGFPVLVSFWFVIFLLAGGAVVHRSVPYEHLDSMKL